MRLKIGLTLATAFAAVGLSPAAAHAGPSPPYNCAVSSYGTEGARAVCASGYGFQRALINCTYDFGSATQWFYGPWTSVGTSSYAFCGTNYGGPVTRSYQTMGV